MVKSTFFLLGSSHINERNLFLDEIKVMKRVSEGRNPHVLKMLGCVTTTFPMMLILQFVPHGNLKNYLRAMKSADDVRSNKLYNSMKYEYVATFKALAVSTAYYIRTYIQGNPTLK